MPIITVVRLQGNVPILNLEKLDKAAERFDGDLDWELDVEDGIKATVEFCTESDKKGFDNLIKRGDALEGIKIVKK